MFYLPRLYDLEVKRKYETMDTISLEEEALEKIDVSLRHPNHPDGAHKLGARAEGYPSNGPFLNEWLLGKQEYEELIRWLAKQLSEQSP